VGGVVTDVSLRQTVREAASRRSQCDTGEGHRKQRKVSPPRSGDLHMRIGNLRALAAFDRGARSGPCVGLGVAVAIPRCGHHGDSPPIGSVVSRSRDARDTRTPESSSLPSLMRS
jgi:hypothetical protein